MSFLSSNEALAEARWLRANPQFEERPATIREFVTERYLDCESNIRPGVMDFLADIFGEKIDPDWISVYRKVLFTGAIGVGKQLREDELILTPTGWRKNGDLRVGDEVIGKNGKPTKVLGVYHHKNVQFYRIHFKDKTWIDAGGPHLWEIWESSTRGISGTGRTERYLKRNVVSTEWLYNAELKNKNDKAYRYRLPLVDAIEYPDRELGDTILDAYTVGYLLGNGGMTVGTPSFSCHMDDCDEVIENLLFPNGLRIVEEPQYNNGIKFHVSGKCGQTNELKKRLSALGLWGKGSLDKFIPDHFMFAHKADRLELLRGLMDSDGHAAERNSIIFSTSCKQLANDAAALVRSLGGYCTINTFERRGQTEYHISINLGSICPFRLERKRALWQPRTNQPPAKSIVSVDKLGIEDGVCIKVAAEDELYVTKDYIVTHNTTVASIVLTYMVHWVHCLRNPQQHFNFMKGTRIAFMMMSTSRAQAKEVVFGDVKARIDYSPWFKSRCRRDESFKNQIRFQDKDLWILPGASTETSYEGYNVLGGILEEGDSHKLTEEKDYADVGYDTIFNRIESRFMDHSAGRNKGLIMIIGQMKSNNGFMSRMYKEFQEERHALVMRMKIWESYGWHNYTSNPDDAKNLRETAPRLSFIFDVMRKEILDKQGAVDAGFWTGSDTENFIEVPNAYIKSFIRNPQKALKDLAGIPPESTDPYISLTDRIQRGNDLWVERLGDPSPVTDSSHDPRFAPWFKATDKLKRVMHVDLAYSAEGDSLGMAMGHVPELVTTLEGEEQPFILFDFLLRIHAAPGTEILFSNVRRLIYDIRYERGFNLRVVTTDGFESTDFRQQLTKRNFHTEVLSVDKSKLPYEDLREAIYDGRCAFPPYMTHLMKGDHDTVNIAYTELSQLVDTGKKIDHPPSGSKDVADAMAGVCHYLMQDSQFRRGAKRARSEGNAGDKSISDISDIIGYISGKNSDQSPVSFDRYKELGAAGYEQLPFKDYGPSIGDKFPW